MLANSLLRPSSFLLALAASCVCMAASCEPAPVDPDDDDTFTPPVLTPDCRPNNDGIIEANEMPFIEGATLRVRVGQNVNINVNGSVGEDGVRVWDLTRPEPQDEPVGALTLESIKDQWFTNLFPDADHAGPLQPGNGLLGPLQIEENGVFLLGSASKDPNPPEGQTLIVYDQPVNLYPFPLAEGVRRDVTSRAPNSVLLGVPMALIDEYQVEVTGIGTVILPDLELENTLRVTLRLRRQTLVGDVQQVTHVLVHECFGEVARFIGPVINSLDEPLDDNFTQAKEVWRLTL